MRAGAVRAFDQYLRLPHALLMVEAAPRRCASTFQENTCKSTFLFPCSSYPPEDEVRALTTRALIAPPLENHHSASFIERFPDLSMDISS